MRRRKEDPVPLLFRDGGIARMPSVVYNIHVPTAGQVLIEIPVAATSTTSLDAGSTVKLDASRVRIHR